MNTKIEKLNLKSIVVHLEPEEFRNWPSESCVECRTPTRYWVTPHIPLCKDCAYLLNQELNKNSLTN